MTRCADQKSAETFFRIGTSQKRLAPWQGNDLLLAFKRHSFHGVHTIVIQTNPINPRRGPV
jgi:hypothetical protein